MGLSFLFVIAICLQDKFFNDVGDVFDILFTCLEVEFVCDMQLLAHYATRMVIPKYI